MTTWRIAAGLVLALSVSWAMPANGQVALYDDFSSGVIAADRWMGYEYEIDFHDTENEFGQGRYNSRLPRGSRLPRNELNEVVVRRIVDGQAQIALTSHLRDSGGHPYAPTSFGPKGGTGLRMNHSALADHDPLVRTFRATVTVANVSVPDDLPGQDCGPLRSGRAAAQLFGHFLNDGANTDSNNLTGDVFAVLALDRRVMRSDAGSTGVRNVMEISIGQCFNRDCSRFLPVGDPQLLPRQWTAGVPYVLTIAWRPATTDFVFTVTGGGFTTSRTVEFVTFSHRRPHAYAYDLRVETHPAHCMDEARVTVGRRVSIDARFDNVQLNSSAAEAAP